MTQTKPELESLDDERDDDLAAGVVHDLAGALTAIGGWAELGLDAADSVPASVALARIRESAATASRLARSLLGHDSERWTDPVELGRQVSRLLRPACSRLGVQITIDAPAEPLPEMPESACFSILWNLAHNAVMMTREGSTVSIHMEHRDDRLLISVMDAGPGMDEATKRRAFDRDFTRRPGGSGRGLGRARHLAHELGGQVQLADSAGGGLRVNVTLPSAARSRSCANRRSGFIARSRPDATTLAGTRVLVVDDDEALRQMLVTSLRLRGAICDEAESVAEANQRRDKNWDVALVDVALTDGSGCTLARELRATGRVRAVVCMSGQTSMPPGAAFRPDSWLRKPFEPDDAMDTIARLAESPPERRAKPS